MHLHHVAHYRNRKTLGTSCYESVSFFDSPAKNTAASFKMARSCSSRLTFFRSALFSANKADLSIGSSGTTFACSAAFSQLDSVCCAMPRRFAFSRAFVALLSYLLDRQCSELSVWQAPRVTTYISSMDKALKIKSA